MAILHGKQGLLCDKYKYLDNLHKIYPDIRKYLTTIDTLKL